MPPQTRSSLRIAVQWSGLIGGPLLAYIVWLLLPEEFESVRRVATKLADGAESVKYVEAAREFTAAGRTTLAMMVWMAVWWLTEAIDIEVTALLPLVAFPLLGVADMKSAAAPFANEIIFLFMGGFFLAASMTRWGLDRRIALRTVRLVGTSPTRMVGGFMLATAMLSAFVSNTATCAMMLPIAVSVINLVRQQRGQAPAAAGSDDPARQLGNFGLCMMLGIAYAASIGGLATIIGTPPNAFLVGFLRKDIADEFRMDVTFGQWLLIGVPLVAVFLPIAWLLLTRVLFRVGDAPIEGGRQVIDDEYRKLGPTAPGEWITLTVFALTAALWIGQPWISKIEITVGGAKQLPLRNLTDGTIAMLGAMLLFLIPIKPREGVFAMNWKTAENIPWGVLILFGGGLSLAEAVKVNGVAEYIGSIATSFQGGSPLQLALAVTTIVIFLTELTSNTATTAALVPVMAALAPGLDVHPYLLVFPTCLAASCAFMLPVGTPPNAMVFGSGYVTIPQMCKAGFWLNVIGILLITLLSMLVLGPVLGVRW